jgi:lipopolysaccharide biosynthesis glycosyltransferase
MLFPIPLFVGYDPREAACYTTFCQSVIDHSSVPVAFTPLHSPMLAGFDGQRDGSNAFIYSRFLVPALMGYSGWAIFVDGDMVVLDDIAKLWAERENHYFDKAVVVVKHDYKTRNPRKYIGTPMEADNVDYPGKNRSSVMLWNCGHYANRRLSPQFVQESPGSFLHRFQWLEERQVGELPTQWNALVGEQDISAASLLHYTCGAPGFAHYAHCDGARHWHKAFKNATHMEND